MGCRIWSAGPIETRGIDPTVGPISDFDGGDVETWNRLSVPKVRAGREHDSLVDC